MSSRWLIISLLGLLAAQSLSAAEVCCSSLTVRDLRKLSPCELDELFASGKACELPIGNLRGHVLYVVTARCPRVAARMNNLVWKGKIFECCGEFVNQFCGFRADRSQGEIGPSWFDGRPCIVLEYPPSAMVFANSRDEIREISPGLYLARYYERCPTPRLKGYFVLERKPDCKD